MKSTILLATALFLISAPSPDSNTITELSSGFLSPQAAGPLLADEMLDTDSEISLEKVEHIVHVGALTVEQISSTEASVAEIKQGQGSEPEK